MRSVVFLLLVLAGPSPAQQPAPPPPEAPALTIPAEVKADPDSWVIVSPQTNCKAVSFHTLPRFVVEDIVYSRVGNTVLSGQCGLNPSSFFESVPNFPDIVVCQFRRSRSFSARLPSFRYHIGRVIGGRSQKEMFRINTGRVVASVADEHTLRNYPLFDRPSNTMRHPIFAAERYEPISCFLERSGPQMASLLSDADRVSRESLFKCHILTSGNITFYGTIPTLIDSDTIRVDEENLPTRFTLSGEFGT